MAGNKERESPRELTIQNKNHGQEQAGNHQGNEAGTQLVPFMEQDAFKKLSFTPNGEDPAFWPIRVLNEVSYYISVKDQFSNGTFTRAMGEKYAPLEETIQQVKTAYSILAYPHCQYEGWQYEIGRELEIDRQLRGRDQVELTDNELQILGQLTTTRKIPFNPEKRIYYFSEVPIAPNIDPFGRRHMTTEEIRKMIPQED